MNFKKTHSTITESKVFKKFKEDNPSSELVAGFFILDLLTNMNQRNLDYRVNDKIFTFSLSEDDEITIKEDKLIEDSKAPKLEKIFPEIRIDLDEIPSLAENIALENKVGKRFQKIIAVLQLYQKKMAWNLTCMLDSFVILNIILDANTQEVLKFDKKSMADFIKPA